MGDDALVDYNDDFECFATIQSLDIHEIFCPPRRPETLEERPRVGISYNINTSVHVNTRLIQ